jgi:hypothetical protein
MKALVVYESMYGNTHTIADQIAVGLRGGCDVLVVPVGEATPERVAAADLLVVGGPTHVHGMTTATSRHSAATAAAKPGAAVVLDPDATTIGLRDWFDALAPGDGRSAAAFDTRMSGPALLTGRASAGITRRLRHHDYRIVAAPASFIVSKDNRLTVEAAADARSWGELLAASAAASSAVPTAHTSDVVN